jgi:hypothetical protein
MSYWEYGKYRAANIKADSFDSKMVQRLLADTIERIGLNGFRNSGLVGTDDIEKEMAAEAKKSGIAALASPKEAEWVRALCGGNAKLRSLAHGFVLALALKHSGMPYKITGEMAEGKMPKTENSSKKGEMGFAFSFGGNENTVVKKVSLAGAQAYEAGYFLAGVHNASLRLLIKLKGASISVKQKERKDMKRLAEELRKLGKAEGFGGFMEIISLCSSFDTMPFPMQRQFLSIYKDLPKPRRMEKVEQPVQSFI